MKENKVKNSENKANEKHSDQIDHNTNQTDNLNGNAFSPQSAFPFASPGTPGNFFPPTGLPPGIPPTGFTPFMPPPGMPPLLGMPPPGMFPPGGFPGFPGMPPFAPFGGMPPFGMGVPPMQGFTKPKSIEEKMKEYKGNYDEVIIK